MNDFMIRVAEDLGTSPANLFVFLSNATAEQQVFNLCEINILFQNIVLE